jgi:hypothetical protein
MCDELEWIWKEAVVTDPELLSHRLPGGTERYHENT